MGKRNKTTEEKAATTRLRRAVGENLRRVREVLGYSGVEFAAKAGLAPNAYNNMERGKSLPSVQTAMALCEAHGLTLDYVYRGDPADLSGPVRRAIEAITTARRQQES